MHNSRHIKAECKKAWEQESNRIADISANSQEIDEHNFLVAFSAGYALAKKQENEALSKAVELLEHKTKRSSYDWYEGV
jgi:hypothetical protein